MLFWHTKKNKNTRSEKKEINVERSAQQQSKHWFSPVQDNLFSTRLLSPPPSPPFFPWTIKKSPIWNCNWKKIIHDSRLRLSLFWLFRSILECELSFSPWRLIMFSVFGIGAPRFWPFLSGCLDSESFGSFNFSPSSESDAGIAFRVFFHDFFVFAWWGEDKGFAPERSWRGVSMETSGTVEEWPIDLLSYSSYFLIWVSTVLRGFAPTIPCFSFISRCISEHPG